MRVARMSVNDMQADERAAFTVLLGRDAWPDASYQHCYWQLRKPAEVPASYVICLRDNILPVAWQETFARRFDAERLIHVDAGHQIMKSRPHTLAEILRIEARSEEHTSELQSLMRNPYAVFCSIQQTTSQNFQHLMMSHIIIL